ncbi:MAG: trimethylamine methyltransferase family protein [Anaerolineae bacterium]|nr:trimethylamine methyltransferase family protein [Anaerolineae bacterium]
MRTNYETLGSPQFQVLSASQVREVVSAAMEVLERAGTRVYGEDALALLRGAGCVVTEEGVAEGVPVALVHIPSSVVEGALQTTPGRIAVAGRDRSKRLSLERDRFYFGTGSDCPSLVDPYSGEVRKYTFDDVYDAARLSDALPNIDFHMSLGLTSGVLPATYDRPQFLAMVKGTSKPLVITAVDAEGLADQYQMACEVLGGPEAFARAPLFVVYIEPSSPLTHSIEAVGKLLYAAEHGIPAIYTPCIMAGGTGPVTMAGTMVQAVAEFLVGVVLAQHQRRGAGVIMGGVNSPMDMSTSILSYGAPELALVSAAMTDVARGLGVPMFSTAGCSDAKLLDQQAAIEATFSIVVAALSGANLIHDVGYLESGLLGSFDMLVMADEVIGMAKRLLSGVRVTPETLAVEVVERVGPGGHFLAQEHTRRHFREEVWFPGLIDRQMRRAWESGGRQTMGARVRARVRHLLESHTPQPLAEGVEARLQEIVAQAEARHAPRA